MEKQPRALMLTCSLFSVIIALSAAAVPESRLNKLKRGINYAPLRKVPPETLDMAEIELFRRAGFHYVRLPVNARSLFDLKNPERLKRRGLEHLDAAIQIITNCRLAVTVEIHDVSPDLWEKDDYADKFARSWRTLAKRLSAYDPEWVFLEMVNEPSAETPEKWNQIWPKILLAMREGAPEHTLIVDANQRVSKNEWDAVRALTMLEPVNDPNVVYNFHFYHPMIFTHQGAAWGWDMLRHFHNIPYPSSPAAVESLLSGIDEQARRYVKEYGAEYWNSRKMARKLSLAANWAQQHGAPLICNEIGVYRKISPPQSRIAYLRDVRTVLERYDIGWAIWFGLRTKSEKKTILDSDVASALGLSAND